MSSSFTAVTFTRPDGSETVMAYCDDRYVHGFTPAMARSQGPYTAMCSAAVHPTRVPDDSDHVCESCLGAINSWAIGGTTSLGRA